MVLKQWDDLGRRARKAKALGLSSGPAARAGYGGSLGATYARVYPGYLRPRHLEAAGVMALFDRARAGERVYACVSLPPRAGKTDTLVAGVVDRLMCDAGARVGYASYSQRLGAVVSRASP